MKQFPPIRSQEEIDYFEELTRETDFASGWWVAAGLLLFFGVVALGTLICVVKV